MNDAPETTTRYPAGYDLGEYEIRKFLGSGSVADVYLARHRQLENEVALKVIRPSVTRAWQEQYARIISALRHPNIVRVHSVARLENHPVIVMDYFRGKTLRQVLREKGTLKLEEALRIASCIAEVLDYLHTVEIPGAPTLAHLDLTPSNIFVDQNGTVKIADSGMVQAMGAAFAPAPDAWASAACVAPEQREGRPCTQSDIWAVGVLLFEMLLGRTPPAGICRQEQVAGGGSQDLQLGTDFEALPGPVRQIILRSLQRNPDERFASAADLESALAEAFSMLGLMKCLKCGELLPPESEVCPECIFTELRESLSQRQRRSTRDGRTAGSVIRRRWCVALAMLVVAALSYGGYRLWMSRQPAPIAQPASVQPSTPVESRQKQTAKATPPPGNTAAAASAEKRETRSWMLAAATYEWQSILALEGSPEGSYEDQVARLRKFMERYTGTPEAWEAREKLRLWEEEDRAFRTTADFEGKPDSKVCAILARWKDFYARQTTGLHVDHARDRIQHWTKRVEDYVGYGDLTVHSARRLPLSDFGLLTGGEPDPYFQLLEGDQVLYRSRTFRDNSYPVWEEKAHIYIRKGMELHLDIWDDDLFGHEMLVRLSLTPFPVDGPFQVSNGIVSVSLDIQRDR